MTTYLRMKIGLNNTLVPANILCLSFGPYNLFFSKYVIAKFSVF